MTFTLRCADHGCATARVAASTTNVAVHPRWPKATTLAGNSGFSVGTQHAVGSAGEPFGPGCTVVQMSRNDELERYRAALRRRLNAEFVERWGVCERGHVLTDANRDSQGRCWCCTRAHERAFAVSEPDVSHGSSGGNLRWIPLRSLLTQ